MIPSFIDYSQYSLFKFCPAAWFERYVAGLDLPWTGQRSDALALGSLVHSGLESILRTGQPAIAQSTVEELSPTPDTLTLANQMVCSYFQSYHAEQFELQYAEELLKFKLKASKAHDGAAKLDAYFFVPEPTTLESGIDGYQLALQPGWYAREYKTKSSAIDRALWMKQWEVRAQADFQLLALSEKVGEQAKGVLVSVLETPRKYIPKRKCQGCKETFELASYLPTSDGKYACMMCGTKQALKPYVPRTDEQITCFRQLATRSAGALSLADWQISTVREEMMGLWDGHDIDAYFNTENCVQPYNRRTCRYFNLHVYGSDPTLVNIDILKYTSN